MTATVVEEPARRKSSPLLRTFLFLRPVRSTAIIAISIIVVRIIFEVFAVYFLSPAITNIARIQSDEIFRGNLFEWISSSDQKAADLRLILYAAVACQLALGVTTYLKPVWESKLSMRAVFQIRTLAFDRLQKSGFAFHDRMTSGKLINRALSDLQAVRNFINISLLSSIDIVCTILAYGAMLMFCSPWLGLLLAAYLPFWWYVIYNFGKHAQLAMHNQQIASDAVITALNENITGVEVVRAFGAEEREKKKFFDLSTGFLHRVFSVIRLQQLLTPAMRGIASLAHISLFALASFLILRNQMQVGDLLIFGVAMGAILNKLQQINIMVEAYQRAKISSNRLFEILDQPDETVGRSIAPPGIERKSAIAIDGVTFRYPGGSHALQSLTANIPSQKITAIVGPTGAGKSTLIALIGRFYDPDEGRVLIDGQDIRNISTSELRRTVGFVFQETFLFTASIRDNIRYGRPDVSDDMVRQAAVAAQADEFITQLDKGYDTLLGEQGVMLSGGQRQRLALARALVYDPAILVLDDATSALDATTELALHRMIRPWLQGRTVIIVAHRINTVKSADHILVLLEGKLIQEGSHEKLRRADGLYRDMVRMQVVGRPLEFSELESETITSEHRHG